jgi:pimeloyl-ACP methyl ester carboxylesterase
MIETRMIPVGEARLAVHLAGRGPLALLVHGYPLDHRMWLEVLHSPLGKRRTLAAVDLRGHGLSPWAGDAVHRMTTFADDLAAVIRTLGDGVADVVALSMGGYAALALCELHPTVLRSLALVDTRAAADTPEGQAARATMAQRVVERGRRWLAEQLVPQLLAPLPDPLVAARVQTMIESTPVETILADLAGMRERKNRRGILAQITVPVQVVVGEKDTITPPAEGEAMARAVPSGGFLVVPESGHLTPMERPDEFVRALDAFWRA